MNVAQRRAPHPLLTSRRACATLKPMKAAEQAKIVSMGRAITEGRYSPCARFARYLDFGDGDDVIGLTDMADDGGAHTLVLAGLRAGWAARADELIVETGAIIFDGQVFARDAQCLFPDSADTGAFAALARAEQRRRLGIFRDTILEHAVPLSLAVALDTRPALTCDIVSQRGTVPPCTSRREFFQGGFARALCDRFLEGADACAAGDYARAASLLQGVGYGLTPSGDDFLCGATLALHFARDERGIQKLAAPLAENLSRSAFMSRTFLRDAIAGRWPRRLRDAAESLGGDDALIRQAVLRALDHGASSGADLLSGFIHTMLHHAAALPERASRVLECA